MPASAAWRFLFLAFTVSVLGNQFSNVAILPKFGSLGGGSTWLVLAALSQAVGALSIAPIAGVLSDRGINVALMLVGDIGRAIMLLCLAATSWLPAAVVLAGLSAALGGFFYPAEGALEAALLTREDVPKAAAARAWVAQMCAIAGPAAAGSLLLHFRPGTVIVIDSMSFVGSAAVIWSIRARFPAKTAAVRPRSNDAGGFGRELRAGFAYILEDAPLRLMFLINGAIYLLLGMQGPIIFAFTKSSLGGTGATFGLLLTALGVGSLAAALAANFLKIKTQDSLGAMTLALIVDSFALFVFSRSHSVLIAACMMTLMGIISAVAMIFRRSFLQLHPPSALRGRVFGWYQSFTSPLMALSLLIALPLAATFSAANILTGASVLEFLTGLVAALLLVRMRRIGAA